MRPATCWSPAIVIKVSRNSPAIIDVTGKPCIGPSHVVDRAFESDFREYAAPPSMPQDDPFVIL